MVFRVALTIFLSLGSSSGGGGFFVTVLQRIYLMIHTWKMYGCFYLSLSRCVWELNVKVHFIVCESCWWIICEYVMNTCRVVCRIVTRTNHLLTINYDMCLCYMRNSKFPRWNIKFIVKCENVFHSCGCFVLEFGLMLLLLLLGVALTHMAFNSFMCIICERCDAVYLCGKEICLRERRRFVSRSNRNSIRALKSL